MRGVLIILILLGITASSGADEGLYPVLKLDRLLEIASMENHELLMARSGVEISRYRIQQAGALPDPMIMIGYENEGWSRYTYGEMPGARWIFSLSQTFPWPGKLSQKELSAEREAESFKALYEKMKLNVIEELKVKYYELLLVYKTIDYIEEKKELLKRLEDITSSRYSSGMATLSELIMAQTEKYMAMEQEIMYKQKIKSLEGMINSLINREPLSPLGRPEERLTEEIKLDENYLIDRAMDSPEIKEIKYLLESRQYIYKQAELEYYPDLTISAQVSLKPEPYEDMWMLSLSFNLPIFYRTKQRNMVLEAKAEIDESYHKLEAAKQMLKANIIDTLSMLRASEELISLYRGVFIPKAEQAFEAAITAYRTGKIELTEVIKALNNLIDYRLNYWRQIIEREKLLSRIERLCGGKINEKPQSSNEKD
ncbi:MAG: TolC family protein [Thermodesulfovibrionales bacterium]|nr:TolC family protein [Thermodesulfovibrionales bacterium]